MDHSDALRLKATEKYLLNELDTEQLDQFEEHLFDCPECAIDVRAGAMLVEQSKAVLTETRGPVPVRIPASSERSWLNWLRPAIAVPAMAALLAIIGYQNLITHPRLQQASNTAQVMPWASLNVGVMGDDVPEMTLPAGKAFVLLVRIPPEGAFTQYTAELHDPSGKVEWSLPIPLASDRDPGLDRWTLRVPGANRTSGTYTLMVHGTTTAGETREIGQARFDLKIQQ